MIAASGFGRRGCDVSHLIGTADAYNHDIPTEAMIERSIGLMTTTDDLVLLSLPRDGVSRSRRRAACSNGRRTCFGCSVHAPSSKVGGRCRLALGRARTTARCADRCPIYYAKMRGNRPMSVKIAASATHLVRFSSASDRRD